MTALSTPTPAGPSTSPPRLQVRPLRKLLRVLFSARPPWCKRSCATTFIARRTSSTRQPYLCMAGRGCLSVTTSEVRQASRDRTPRRISHGGRSPATFQDAVHRRRRCRRCCSWLAAATAVASAMLAASIVRRLALREPLIVRREPVVDAAGLRGAGGGAFDRLVRRLGAVRSARRPSARPSRLP